MNLSLVLTVALLAASSGFSQDLAQPPTQQIASELVRLEQVLTLAQEAKQQDRLAPERYEEFLKQFRASLDEARAATPPSSTASALYARILARLGDPKQALTILAPELDQDPENPSLRVALGHVRFEEKNYPAAYAEAEAVLKREPKNEEALALKYFSKGRIDGTASTRGALPASGLAEASLHQDPRIAEAGRRALARKSAIGFTDKAMGRLKIKDPGEALRYLALAEAIDPGYADVPMQQGLAYADLKRHAAAIERFTKAEALWRARATPQTDELADLARQFRESEAANLNPSPKPAQSPASQPEKPAAPFPLLPIALFTTGAFAAYSISRSRQTATSEDGLNENQKVPLDNEHRNWVMSAKATVAAICLLAAWEFGAVAFTAARAFLTVAGPAAPAMQLAAAGAGAGGSATGGGSVVLEQAVVGTAKALTLAGGAYVAANGTSEFVSYAKSDGTFDHGNQSESTSESRGRYRRVEIQDEGHRSLGEFDEIDLKRGQFIEDKSAQGLGTSNPRTGLPNQTAEQWAEKQIFKKTIDRIEALKKAVGTRPTRGGSQTVPELGRIRNIRRLEFRVDANTAAVRAAVGRQVQRLSLQHPDWVFSAIFGQ